MKFLMSLICVLGLNSVASAVVLRSAYKSNLCMDVNRGDPSNWRFQKNLEVWPCNANDNQQFGLQPLSVSANRTNFALQTLGKCLDVDLGYTESWTNKSNVQIYDCNGNSNQLFQLEPRANGWFIIRSVFDGRCLDIDLNHNNGWRFEHNVQLWNCSGESNQLWKFDDDNGNGDIILNPIS